MYNKGSSGYFFKKDQGRFNSHQDYVEQTELIVHKALEQLNSAVQEKKDLPTVFHEIMSFFGKSRHDLAVKHNTNGSEEFGIRREDPANLFISTGTGLYEPYEEFNKRLLPTIQTHLRTMLQPNINTSEVTTFKTPTQTTMGKKTYLEISILSLEKKMEWGFSFTLSNYIRICGICSITPTANDTNVIASFNALSKNKTAMRILKDKSIDDYKKLKNALAMSTIHHDFNNTLHRWLTDWVLITVRHQINNKMYATSQYITYINRNCPQDTIDEMEKSSIIYIMHQDIFLIESTLNEISILFKEAIEWDKSDPKLLIEKIALINYEFANAMPFKRGSAAICEWIEMTLYRYHGFSLEYKQETSINMEALILPFDQFIQKYPSLIKIEPIDKMSHQSSLSI